MRVGVEEEKPHTPYVPPTKTEMIEAQIQAVYEQAPTVEVRSPREHRRVVGYKPVPTPEQEQQIIELAKQLPPEKRKEYIIEVPVEEPPKGIGETLASVSIPELVANIVGLKGEKREQYLQTAKILQPKLVTGQLMPIWGEPVKTLGGIVASVEAPVYTVGRLVGLETPRIPPTVVGGVIGKPFGSAELERAMEYGPSYAAGTVMGDILVSVAVSKGAEKILPESIKKFLTKVEEKTVGKLGELWKGSDVEMWLVKHSKMYERYAMRGITPGEVGIAQLAEGPATLKDVFATDIYWEMIQVPRTAGVMVAKPPAITVGPQTYIFEWVLKAGAQELVPRFRPVRTEEFIKAPTTKELPTFYGRAYFEKYPWRMATETGTFFQKATLPTVKELHERGLLPYVTQTYLTRMGVVPYAPTLTGKTATAGLSYLAMGIGIKAVTQTFAPTPSVVAKPISKTYPFELEKVKFDPLKYLAPEIKEREKAVPIPKLVPFETPISAPIEVQKLFEAPAQVPVQTPKTALLEEVKQIQKQTQILKMPTPTPTILKVPKYKWPYDLTKRKPRRKGGKLIGLYGRYKRFYPVMPARKALRKLIGLDI